MASKQQNSFRIVGGRHRSRRLGFPDVPGLRPSPDRVRETVFNWLQPVLAGARVLDLFAGSGAFGLEALSRGAKSANFVELAPAAAIQLVENIKLLKESADVHQGDALVWLDGPQQVFDIVFLDPPYQAGLLEPALARLSEGGWLAPGALVYLECARQQAIPELPEGWTLLKEKTTGGVHYHLLRAP